MTDAPWTIKACLLNKPVNEFLWNEAMCAYFVGAAEQSTTGIEKSTAQ